MGRLLVAVSSALFLVLAAGAAAADPVAVSPTGDAEADYVAVSGTGASRGLVAVSATGDASSGGPGSFWTCYATVCVSGVAASGLGEAWGGVAASAAGDAWAGNAQYAALCVDAVCANGLAASGLGDAYGIVALSGAGHATGGVVCLMVGPVCFLAILAVGGAGADEAIVTASLLGDAGRSAGLVGASVLGDAHGDVAAFTAAGDAWTDSNLPVSVLGRCNGTTCFDLATNEDAEGYWLAASATGDADAPIAASLLGDAVSRCDFFYCVALSGLGDASGVSAVSAGGDATSPCPADAVCPSVSGIGDSSGGSTPFSACRAASDFSGQETCLDPQATLQLGFA